MGNRVAPWLMEQFLQLAAPTRYSRYKPDRLL
jgi:hypothetical protein